MFTYLSSTKNYIIIRSDGEGKIFQFDKNDGLNLNITKSFKTSLNKFEELKVLDEKNHKGKTPITVLNG